MSQVELRNLRKVYGRDVVAVRQIDLEIEDGEFMVLVGPSGCAKSTTLRMIAGLEDITGGEILIDGVRVNDTPPGKRGISMVFQNYALYPHMNVTRNLSFGLRMARRPEVEIETGVDRVSSILQIGELLERLPGQLSGGQAQRVAVGRALIKEPKVFLFDEPLSNLDAKLRASMRVRITDLHRRLRAEGKSATVIYVTHDQTEAMTMGDRICVMDAGRIMQVDTPQRLFVRPANTFVAGFLGSPEMNLLPAQVDREAKKLVVEGQVIALEPDFVQRIQIDGPAVLGVRAQHLDLVEPGAKNAFGVEVRLVEFMGHAIYVYIRLGTLDLVAVVDSDTIDLPPRIGDTLRIKLRQPACHIFDPHSDQNVSLSPETGDRPDSPND